MIIDDNQNTYINSIRRFLFFMGIKTEKTDFF